jgi:Family of unknown function (DUF6308)
MQDQSSTPAVRVGRFLVARPAAVEIVSRYIARPNPNDRRKPHAFDIYDAYRADTRHDPLDQADLLAPVLLGVQNLSPDAYRWLTGKIEPINEVLERIDPEVSLSDPEPALDPLYDLFSVLDDESRHGIRMTILSKILHRKRPRLIPLWDAHSLTCYSQGPACPVPEQRGRSRRDYAVEITRCMHADLRAGKPIWEELSRLSGDRELTELRALDILAWTVGQHPELAAGPPAA